MTKNRTLGGAVCPQYCDIYVDQCGKCKKHVVVINDTHVYEGCRCLKPELRPGMAHKVETARIVDALRLQYDSPEDRAVATASDQRSDTR